MPWIVAWPGRAAYRVSPDADGERGVSESGHERPPDPARHRGAGHDRRRRRRDDRPAVRRARQRRHAPPGDRPDVPVRRARDLGPRARQPDGQADDRRRADLVHRHRRSARPSRSSASSRSRSRTRSPCCSSPWCSPIPTGRLESRIDRAAVAILAVGATALNILYSTSLPLITDKSSGLYGGLALATMADGGDPPPLGHRARAFAARPAARADRGPGVHGHAAHQHRPPHRRRPRRRRRRAHRGHATSRRRRSRSRC